MKVLYIGHYKEFGGWAEAAKNYILALDSVGVDVVCRNVTLTKDREISGRLKELEEKDTDGCTVCIQHVLPHHLCGTSKFDKNIAFLASESHSIKHHSWIEFLNQMDDVWVPNKQSKENLTWDLSVFRWGTSPKVSVVPHTFNTDKYKKDYICFTGIRKLYNCIKIAWYGGNRINNSDLLIRNKDKIKILTDSDSISIFINTYNDQINIINEDNVIELNTSNKFEWVEISNFKNKNLLFELNKNSFIKILGIKTKESKNNYWSWDDDYKIEVQRGENIFKYTINKYLFPTINKCFFSNIVNDFGSSVVLKFKC